MAFTKVNIHSTNLNLAEKRLKKESGSKDYKQVNEFLTQLVRGEVTGKEVGVKRKIKLIGMFLIYFKNYKKNLTDLELKDLQKIKDDLLNDSIKKENGESYSQDTKEDFTETICRFLEWNNPKKTISYASRTLPFRKWFIIRAKRKTPEILSEEEVQKLYDGTKSVEGKFAIAVLFDSGVRIEEFLNLRFEDFEEPTTNNPYYRIEVREEYSKTDGRKIGMYWKNSTEAIARYLGSIEKKDMKDRVYDKNYDSVRMFITRLGKKILNKRVHPHMLRKSSATHYASTLNRQQICVRYGWKFKSDMVDTYIKRSGVDENKVRDLILNDDISQVRRENKEIKTKYDSVRKELDWIKKKFLNTKVMNEMETSYDFMKEIVKVIKKMDNPELNKHVMDIQKKQLRKGIGPS